jgi:hypothetical protein
MWKQLVASGCLTVMRIAIVQIVHTDDDSRDVGVQQTEII